MGIGKRVTIIDIVGNEVGRLIMSVGAGQAMRESQVRTSIERLQAAVISLKDRLLDLTNRLTPVRRTEANKIIPGGTNVPTSKQLMSCPLAMELEKTSDDLKNCVLIIEELNETLEV